MDRVEAAQLLGWLAEQVGRKRGTLDHLARAWADALGSMPAASVRRAVEGLLDTEPTKIPTLAQVRAEVARAGGVVSSASCGRCWQGLREVAIRAERRGEVDTRVVWAHCDCDAGMSARSARATRAGLPPTIHEVTERARQADPRAAIYVDPTPEQRRSDAERRNLAAGQEAAGRREREARMRRERLQATRGGANGGRDGSGEGSGSDRASWSRVAPGMEREVDRHRERMGFADGDDPGPEAWL